MKLALFSLLALAYLPNCLAQSEGPKIDWVYNVDGYNTTDFSDLDLDEKGNIYVAINHQMKLQIPELKKTELPFPRHLGAVIIKFDSNGKPIWVTSIAGSYFSLINTLYVAKNGDILVTGNADGIVRFASTKKSDIKRGKEKERGRIHQPETIFLARYSPEGNVKWVKTLDKCYGATGISIVENSQGKIYWSYRFSHELRDAGVLIDSHQPGSKEYDNYKFGILELSPDGKILGKHPFFRTHYHSNPLYHNKLAIDHRDNLLIHGQFRNSIKFDENDSLSNDGYLEIEDAFIVKYDPNDQYLWSRKIGGQWNQHISDLRVDSKNNIYLTGSFDYECIISNGITLIQNNRFKHSGGQSFFYARFQQDGDLDYTHFNHSRGFGTYYRGMALDLDQHDRVHLIGSHSDTIQFEGSDVRLPRRYHDVGEFYTCWQGQKLQSVQKNIKSDGWAIPMDIVCKNGNCVVGGLYWGKNEMKDVQGKRVKFSNKDHGRSAFIYSFLVPQLPKEQPSRTDSLDHLAHIKPVIACLPPKALDRDDIWIPIDSLAPGELPQRIQKRGCGVILDSCSASLFPNPTKHTSKLVLKGMKGKARLEIYNSAGAYLSAQEINIEEERQSFELDFSQVARGTYYVHLSHGNYRKIMRLVKQ